MRGIALLQEKRRKLTMFNYGSVLYSYLKTEFILSATGWLAVNR
jgi:hypothetical protein